MTKSDWFALICAVAFAGVGAVLATYGKRMMRKGGFALIAAGVLGLVAWFTYYRDLAEAQPSGGSCNNYGANGTIIGSCNNTTISPPRERSGLYQGDLKVGSIQGTSMIDTARGIATFEALALERFPKPDKPLEYGDLLLICNDLPRNEPNKFVGIMSAMVAGARCTIVGKR